MYVAGLAALAMRHIETTRQQVRGSVRKCGLRAALAMRHIKTTRQQVRGGMEKCGLREKPSRWVWCWEVREIV